MGGIPSIELEQPVKKQDTQIGYNKEDARVSEAKSKNIKVQTEEIKKVCGIEQLASDG